MEESELAQVEWWNNTYLPLVRQALRGEYVHPWLLEGGMLEQSADLEWDRYVDAWADN